tara:strand:+ start:1005 stop:1127 length:123 start_codon:yes stop_codon:yes gene_type:complete
MAIKYLAGNVLNNDYKYLWRHEEDVDAKVKGATIESTKWN